MRKTLLLIATCCLQGMTIAQEPVYRQASAPIEERVSDLLGRMTLEEKNRTDLLSSGMGNVHQSQSGQCYHLGQIQTTDGRSSHRFLLGCSPCRSVDSENSGNRTESPAGAKALNALQKYAVEHTRLGIPVLFAEECPHGHMAIGATSIPYFHGTGLNME